MFMIKLPDMEPSGQASRDVQFEKWFMLLKYDSASYKAKRPKVWRQKKRF